MTSVFKLFVVLIFALLSFSFTETGVSKPRGRSPFDPPIPWKCKGKTVNCEGPDPDICGEKCHCGRFYETLVEHAVEESMSRIKRGRHAPAVSSNPTFWVLNLCA